MKTTKRGLAAVAGGAVILLPAPGVRADFIWSGDALSNLWTNADNWVDDVAPPLNLGGQSLIFGLSESENRFPNAATGEYSGIGGLSFTNANVGYRLVGPGASLSFEDGAVIENDSAFEQTIDVAILGNGSSLVFDASAGSLSFRRRIDMGDDATLLTVRGAFDIEMLGGLQGENASLLKEGSNTLTLAGANDFGGGVTLAAGAILLGNNEALGTGTLTLSGDGSLSSSSNVRTISNLVDLGGNTLTLDGDRNLTMEGVISGTGNLIVDLTDERILTLTADSTYTGGTTVREGELRLDGSLASGIVVEDAGVLSGAGSMTGDLTVQSGGTIRPAGEESAVGTLTVDGNHAQDAGSTYGVDLDFDAATSDLLDVSGTSTLASGSTISVLASGQSYVATGTSFTVLEADGGITNAGVDVTTSSESVTVGYALDPAFMDGNTSLGVIVTRAADAYSSPTEGGNNRSIGLALDELLPVADADPAGGAGDLLGRLDTIAGADYNTAVGQLSPQSYRTGSDLAVLAGRTFAAQQSEQLADRRGTQPAWMRQTARRPQPGSLALARADAMTIAQAVAQADDPPAGDPLDPGAPPPPSAEEAWQAWAQVQGIFATQDRRPDRTGYDATGVGGQIGFDKRFSRGFVGGLALGFSYANATFENDLGDFRDYGFRIGPYMTVASGPWFLDASASFAYHYSENERAIPTLALTAEGDYSGFEGTAYVATGWSFEPGQNVFITPTISAQYSYLHSEGFTESGAGGANLDVDSRNSDSLRGRLGLSASVLFEAKATIVPSLFGGWEHEFLDGEDPYDSRFVSGGGPFPISVASRDKDAFFIGGGVNVLLPNDVSFFVRYEWLESDTGNVSAILGGLSWVF